MIFRMPGFALTADVASGHGSRWVEGHPARRRRGGRAGTAARQLPARADDRDLAELAGRGVDVDAEIMGGEGVPPLFFFRDHDENTLMIARE